MTCINLMMSHTLSIKIFIQVFLYLMYTFLGDSVFSYASWKIVFLFSCSLHCSCSFPALCMCACMHMCVCARVRACAYVHIFELLLF